MSETNSLKLTDKDKVQIFGSSDDVVEKIISDKPFSIDGYIKVNADNMTYELNDYYDFANVNKYAIAKWAYHAKLIRQINYRRGQD
jgi:hypothetical protein